MTAQCAEDFAYWRKTDTALADRIEMLLQCVVSGAPLSPTIMAPLVLQYAHLLSVKITPEHRLVCERRRSDLIVHQCRYHY